MPECICLIDKHGIDGHYCLVWQHGHLGVAYSVYNLILIDIGVIGILKSRQKSEVLKC